MSASKQKNHQNIINPDNFTPNGNGLFVPSASGNTEAPPVGGTQLTPEMVATISGNAAQAAINGVLGALQGSGSSRRSRGIPTASVLAPEVLSELNNGLLNFSNSGTGTEPRVIRQEADLPDGHNLVRHSADPRVHHGDVDPKPGVAKIPNSASRAEAIAINDTNAASSTQLGPKFAGEYNAIDENGNYRTLQKRINPDTGDTEFVDEGNAILTLATAIPGYETATAGEIATREHIQHARGEAMLCFVEASRIESMLNLVIGPRVMLSRGKVDRFVDPAKLDEILNAKLYDAKGTYVGPSTDPEITKELMSLVELAEMHPKIAGKIRVFNKNGEYVGPSTDPEITETLRGYANLDVPVRTRQYLRTELTPSEKKVTERQLKMFLEAAKKGNEFLREARHHVAAHGSHGQHDDHANPAHGDTEHPAAPHAPTAVADTAPKIRLPRLRNAAQKAAAIPGRVKNKVMSEAQKERTRFNEVHADNLWDTAERLNQEAAHHRKGLEKNGEPRSYYDPISENDYNHNAELAVMKQSRADKLYKRVDKISTRNNLNPISSLDSDSETLPDSEVTAPTEPQGINDEGLVSPQVTEFYDAMDRFYGARPSNAERDILNRYVYDEEDPQVISDFLGSKQSESISKELRGALEADAVAKRKMREPK